MGLAVIRMSLVKQGDGVGSSDDGNRARKPRGRGLHDTKQQYYCDPCISVPKAHHVRFVIGDKGKFMNPKARSASVSTKF